MLRRELASRSALPRAFAIALLALVAAQPLLAEEDRVLPRPADWSQSDLYNFVESAVQIAVGDAHGAYGGRIPLVDVYSTISGVSAAVKPGMILWLRRKMADAATAEDFARFDRYNAFYTCLSKDDCTELRALEQELRDREPVGPTTDDVAVEADDSTSVDLDVADESVSIEGPWNSSIGYTYQIAHTGSTFTWTVTNQPQLGETGSGELTGTRNLKASWTNVNGSGSAEGSVGAVDANGRATRIDWTNGVVFTRE